MYDYHLYYWCIGSSITCNCNVNHPACINNSCVTEYDCERQLTIDYVNNTTLSDNQLCCNSDDEIREIVECRGFFNNDTVILFRLCCRGTDYCNSNDTAVAEFLNSTDGLLSRNIGDSVQAASETMSSCTS